MTDAVKPASKRVRLKRLNKRGAYDRASIDAILDAMPLAHVGYVFDGAPYVTPTLQWREGDHVYWHGSSASRMLRAAEDTEVCLTVSLLDGMVLARSAFHHSVNYRSVMLLGRAFKVTDPEEKAERFKGLIEALYPGRWDMLRPVKAIEVKATSVLGMKIAEGSAKVRTGPPIDDEEDNALPIWAGVVPVSMRMGKAVADSYVPAGLGPPAHVGKIRIG